MEQFLTPQYLVIFGLAILGFVAWRFFEWRKKKNQKPSIAAKSGGVVYKPVDALIFDRTTTPFSWYEQTIPVDIVQKIVEAKTIGRQVVYNGKKVFRFYKLLDMKSELVYEGVTEPSDVKHSPIAAYIDNQHPYTPILDDMTVDKNFMQKYGHLLIWLGVIAFLIVMIVKS